MMPRPISLRNLIVGFSSGVVLLLLGLSGFSAYEVDRHAGDLAWVKHSDIVVDLLQRSCFQIEIAERARQAFLITGASSAREEVIRAATSVRANAEALQKMTTDNPTRVARAEELATLSAAIRSSVETRVHRGSPGEGAPALKRAESLARSMEVVERGLQDERDLREQQSVNSSLAALGAEVLFALALSSVALWLILRGIDQREMLLLEMARPAILMQTVLDHAQAAVSLIDLDGRVIFVNKESARILGILPDAAVGRLLAEFMPSKEATSIMADNTRVHASGSVWTTEMTFAGADGSRVYLSRKMPMPASGDRPPTVCSITTDITSFRAHERSLLDANAELDAFSYSVAHDLRARLKAIDGFANSLQKEHAGTLAGEPLRLVSHVRADVEHMSRLIDALLSFSRIGRLALRDENVDMAGLARRAIADVAEAEQGNNVRLEIGDVPACHGDAAMLALVWSNLVSNAYKFTRPRVPACIKIGGALRQDAIEYWIKDDGVGFDPNHVGNLFSAFSRLHEGTKFEGTGIGLALVRRIVERHGGGVSAEGSVNGGAVFRFTLQRRKIT